MIKFILGVFLLLDGCHQCPDKKFEEKINNTIKTFELLKSEGITLHNNIYSVKIASQIITTLTGIRPHISYEYTVTYMEKDFINDMSKWHKWYEENKCKVNDATFDSIALKVRSNYPR